MDSEFHELRTLPELKGTLGAPRRKSGGETLNAVISEARRQRRPLSLSESFAHSPMNIERAASSNSLTLLVEERPSPTQDTSPVAEPSAPITAVTTICFSESDIVGLVLRFLFHITLISIFETVFFFIYVSTLEDSGILKTIHSLTDGVVHSCSNLTAIEQNLADDLLSPFFNVTEIDQQATAVYATRSRFNARLFRNAWIYVGGLGCLFLLGAAYSRYRKISVAWRSLLLENIGLVTLLAVYEYMFFTTIIFPYSAISGQEIEQELVSEVQSQCGLLLNQTM